MQNMNWNRIRWGVIFCLLGVVLGAFGAHTLETLLSPDRLESFTTGVRYQFLHGLALLFLGLLSQQVQSNLLTWTARLLIGGTILFSGSIYLLSCRDILGLTNIGWLGPITPLGGTLLIVGWALLLVQTFRK